jgi:hypothetical protein
VLYGHLPRRASIGVALLTPGRHVLCCVCRELAERKSQFAQELSATQMEVVDYRKASETASKRAEEAEAFQRMVQNEIAEAKVVQKYNLQLHK